MFIPKRMSQVTFMQPFPLHSLCTSKFVQSNFQILQDLQIPLIQIPNKKCSNLCYVQGMRHSQNKGPLPKVGPICGTSLRPNYHSWIFTHIWRGMAYRLPQEVGWFNIKVPIYFIFQLCFALYKIMKLLCLRVSFKFLA